MPHTLYITQYKLSRVLFSNWGIALGAGINLRRNHRKAQQRVFVSASFGMRVRGQDVSGDQEHAAKDHEKCHEWIAMPIHKAERPYPRVQGADHGGDEQGPTIAGTKALPHPNQRYTEREHAPAHEIPDHKNHRMQIGLDWKLVNRRMDVRRLKSVAERSKTNHQTVEQENHRCDFSQKDAPSTANRFCSAPSAVNQELSAVAHPSAFGACPACAACPEPVEGGRAEGCGAEECRCGKIFFFCFCLPHPPPSILSGPPQPQSRIRSVPTRLRSCASQRGAK